MTGEREQPAFAHPSEEEFARILDFYGVRWVYEPRSFLLREENGQVAEMFTPDFYLPDFGLYIELTTMKQSLVTAKNRKLRQLRDLYPDVNIKLLYKKDIHRLLARYGFGPLVEGQPRSVDRILFTPDQIQARVGELAQQVAEDFAGTQPVVIGVLKGMMYFMADLTRRVPLPLSLEFMAISYYGAKGRSVRITKDLDRDIEGRHVLLLEDIVDTGMTLNYLLSYLRAHNPAALKVCALLDKRARRLVDVPLDYVGFEVPDEFLVGYGLDYGERFRNLPFIGILHPEGGQKEVDPK